MIRRATAQKDKENVLAMIRMGGDALEYRVSADLPGNKAIWIDKKGVHVTRPIHVSRCGDLNTKRVSMGRAAAVKVAEAAHKKGTCLLIEVAGYIPGEAWRRINVWTNYYLTKEGTTCSCQKKSS